MPIKYIFDIPEPVKYFGWIHGVLFLFYLVVLIIAAVNYKWSITRIVIYIVGSVLPFVPFILDKNLKKEYAQNK